jgi:para-aminobenzoate synthetase component I
MLNSQSFEITDHGSFKSQLLQWLKKHPVFCLISNSQPNHLSENAPHPPEFQLLAGVQLTENKQASPTTFQTLEKYIQNTEYWYFGYFGYDLKNQTEKLVSENHDELGFSDMFFFKPDIVVALKNTRVEIIQQDINPESSAVIFTDIQGSQPLHQYGHGQIKCIPRFTKKEYTTTIKELKNHIQRGDIYEINFCQEFFSRQTNLDPFSVYHTLDQSSPAPFSCFLKVNEKYLMSISPERFLTKLGSQIVSQPMKGTAKRSQNPFDDNKNKEILLSAKEQSENIMITDLVRNDLAKTASRGSVKVEELCGIYSYRQAHQMISTITSQLAPGFTGIDAIKHAFPMGSMTGAPKIKAMQLIEKHERSKRGLFSGSLGYFAPGGNFDFNVIIRTILYNKLKKYVSFTVGSAITGKSDPEAEYDECLVKAAPLMYALNPVNKNETVVS